MVVGVSVSVRVCECACASVCEGMCTRVLERYFLKMEIFTMSIHLVQYCLHKHIYCILLSDTMSHDS